MNMFARFDEIPAMTLQDIKETNMDGECENSIPSTNRFAGGITNNVCGGYKYTFSATVTI